MKCYSCAEEMTEVKDTNKVGGGSYIVGYWCGDCEVWIDE